MALIRITDASGREWQHPLSAQDICAIGRAPDNNHIVLTDPQASRHHAHITYRDGFFCLVDGVVVDGQIRRSANHVFVNGALSFEHNLTQGDVITIGASTLRFEQTAPVLEPAAVEYDDDPLGRTQVLISASEVIRSALQPKPAVAEHDEEMRGLRRKADVLSLLYEMSSALGSVFTLEALFEKATDILLRVTPADRVIALLTDGVDRGPAGGDLGFKVVASKVRDPKLEAWAKQTTIGRTVTRKVVRQRVALLSQDLAADPELASESVLAQGVRSTICAPLIAESRVLGVLYADRLDPLTAFTRDDLQLATAIAAQAAVAVENVQAHERLAREEVARAAYARFLPEYVVQQILQHPESFKLGGVNQTITVLFADIRGFTRLSEHAPPDRVVQLLNRYFSGMSDIIFKHGGTLDKYIGDGLMALFGAPTVTVDDARNAVIAAMEMHREMAWINEDVRSCGLGEISIGIGLHTGDATVGFIGSERRSEYTAIGDTVNLSARLESNSKPGQILASEATRRGAGREGLPFVPCGSLTVKNRQQPVQVFEIEWRSLTSTEWERGDAVSGS
jgi:adenylate cyclase